MCLYVRVLTLSNMNISLTSRPIIAIKYYLKHQWDGGKAVFGFGPVRIRTLVFLATDSSQKGYIGGGEMLLFFI